MSTILLSLYLQHIQSWIGQGVRLSRVEAAEDEDEEEIPFEPRSRKVGPDASLLRRASVERLYFVAAAFYVRHDRSAPFLSHVVPVPILILMSAASNGELLSPPGIDLYRLDEAGC